VKLRVRVKWRASVYPFFLYQYTLEYQMYVEWWEKFNDEVVDYYSWRGISTYSQEKGCVWFRRDVKENDVCNIQRFDSQ
jgi:hypothetical protein